MEIEVNTSSPRKNNTTYPVRELLQLTQRS